MTLPLLDAAPVDAQRPYAPLGAQCTVFACRDREVIVVGPADTGKTRTIFERIHRALERYPGARVLYCRKTRESCTDSGLVTFEERVLPPGHPVKRGPARLNRHAYRYDNGSELVVGGLDKLGKLRSSEYDWIYVQEVSEASEDDWENLLRACSGRAGGLPFPQLIGDMNPEHPLHWAHARCDAGRATEIYIGHADNPSLTPERLEALARMTGARRQRFYEGRRVVDVDGSYYGQLLWEAERDGRFKVGLPVDPVLPVYTSWDLGVADFHAIWFWQVAGRERWVIDYYEMAGEGLRHYAEVLQRKGYVYGGHYLPHDIRARVQAETAETRLDILRRLLPGQRLTVVPRTPSVEDRIEAARAVIPLCWWDNSKAPPDEPWRRNTAQGIQRLIAYRREVNEATGTFTASPRHNEASHAADAFGTFAQGWREVRPMPKAREERKPWHI